MMLFKNDLFQDQDGHLYRLLEVTDAGMAWVINMEAPLSLPEERSWANIVHFNPVPANAAYQKHAPRPSSAASPAQKKRAERAWTRIAPLVEKVPDVFVPSLRAKLIAEHAPDAACSTKTLLNTLREYWRGGQTIEALLGKYHQSGRSVAVPGSTAGRGRRPTKADREVYQLTERDLTHIKSFIKQRYLTDERITLTKAFSEMLSAHYVSIDGNGKAWQLPEGKRPTLRQFSNVLHKNYGLEVRLRSRKGDKEFERNHRQKLGTIRLDCNGVGHIYEIDATIVDLYLVSEDNVRKIIGKTTLYIIIDRGSRLIVGFYLGLENASWIGAMQAILSISSDKAKLCQRYGVQYDPEDWPAHQVFPKEFFADRGEMISKASNQVADGIRSTVTNMPSLRPDWKPCVEGEFKLIHQQIADHAPAYDPPSNATKRRGKHYEKDACLTLGDFTKIILQTIIAHNRKPLKKADLSLEEISLGIETTPISLWNHGIQTRSGQLTRYTEDQVRFKLLPREEATVTDQGIHLRGCYYACAEAIAKGWFVQARKHRFKISVSYDPRSVDAIYIHDSADRTNYFVGNLTDRSSKYSGLSFSEVAYYEKLMKLAEPAVNHTRLQVDHEYREEVMPTVNSAKAKLKAAGKIGGRTSRRADVKEDRTKALKQERRETVVTLPSIEKVGNPKPTAQLLSIVKPAGLTQATSEINSIPPEELTRMDKIKMARERMLNG